MPAENSGSIHKMGDRYTIIKMMATTRPVVSSRLESREPKAPNRSESIAAIPVT